MEFAAGGELKEYVHSRGRLDESEARAIFEQLLEAIGHCHALNVIHRDLKLENVLFSDSGHKKIKIVDFGIAGLVQDDKAEKSKAGSLKYMAPEVLSGENIEARPSLDIWSMGCILFAMVCGELPFSGKTSAEIIDKIKKGEYQFPHNVTVSYHCRKLIRSMLNVDYKRRITIREIMQHPWLIEGGGKTPATPIKKTPTLIKTPVKRMTPKNVKEEASKKINVLHIKRNKGEESKSAHKSAKHSFHLPHIDPAAKPPVPLRKAAFYHKQSTDVKNTTYYKGNLPNFEHSRSNGGSRLGNRQDLFPPKPPIPKLSKPQYVRKTVKRMGTFSSAEAAESRFHVSVKARMTLPKQKLALDTSKGSNIGK